MSNPGIGRPCARPRAGPFRLATAPPPPWPRRSRRRGSPPRSRRPRFDHHGGSRSTSTMTATPPQRVPGGIRLGSKCTDTVARSVTAIAIIVKMIKHESSCQGSDEDYGIYGPNREIHSQDQPGRRGAVPGPADAGRPLKPFCRILASFAFPGPPISCTLAARVPGDSARNPGAGSCGSSRYRRGTAGAERGAWMHEPKGRYYPLVAPRRFIGDLVHFARRIPSAPVSRTSTSRPSSSRGSITPPVPPGRASS